jgi:N-acetylmuramoyl-L-alanine amidase
VVIKLRDQDARPMVASLAAADGSRPRPSVPEALRPLLSRFPNAVARPLIQSASPARLDSMVREAQRATERRLPELRNFYSVALPAGTDARAVVAAARELRGVEEAHVQGGPTPPPVITSTDDPRSTNQGYLGAAPAGIDARRAWRIPGGDGRGITFIDIEQGWTLNHEDLSGAGIRLLSGRNQAYFGHGTSVLGEIMSQDNTRGCIGITPIVTGRMVSQWRSASNYSTADAVVAAILATRSGDVILLEAQTTVGGSSFLPVEVELDVWAAIYVGCLLGRVIVEAGGNGSNDLDAYNDATFGRILRRGHADFRESGAIMVGAGSSAAPHTRLSFSNFGSRIDCYAWGQNIDTTGDGWTGNLTTSYTTTFGGTSGASPIVTAVAIALQGMTKAKDGRPLSPRTVREVLSNRANGTPSANPAIDRIGVMPDLKKIIDNRRLAPPVGDFPLPRGDTRVAALIDPGHGGEEDRILSAAYGSPANRSRGGSSEKDINLQVARTVCDQLGTRGVLTRTGDYNLSLRERIERARQAGASAFVSIHSDTGRLDRSGPEVWVYGDRNGAAGAASQQLAQRIRSELEAVERSDVPVRSGKLAVLRPDLHGSGVAACLVETGSLQHPAGRARLSDRRTLDGIGQAVARGVSRYLSMDLGGE